MVANMTAILAFAGQRQKQKILREPPAISLQWITEALTESSVTNVAWSRTTWIPKSCVSGTRGCLVCFVTEVVAGAVGRPCRIGKTLLWLAEFAPPWPRFSGGGYSQSSICTFQERLTLTATLRAASLRPSDPIDISSLGSDLGINASSSWDCTWAKDGRSIVQAL